MNIDRALDITATLNKKSCFLFGPRQTGKSWLIRHALRQYPVYNLLDSETYLKLSRNPSRIREECDKREKIVIIDEIQKLPALLDEVHFLIEERGIHFLLTGSSARKLRRGGVNLLGGRARIAHLYPLTFRELKSKFDLVQAVNNGLLPSIYFSDAPHEDLEAYVGTYLKEEIAAEGLTRNIPAFSRFLEVAALCNGQMLNLTKISNDAQVARSTVQEYFEVLKDTLIACEIPPWAKSRKRKPILSPKFYFFDFGVARSLQHRSRIEPGSPEFGEGFETYLCHELRAFAEYRKAGEVAYWRSASGFEVDFTLSDRTAIEVKATKTVSPQDLRGLKALRDEGVFKNYVVVSLESKPRIADGIHVLPWRIFLEELWDGKF